MQIKITLKSDKRINLPIAYRHAVQSVIYNSLRVCEDYSYALHNSGNSEQRASAFKLFTFGPLDGSYTLVDKRLIFEEKINLEIRCYDPFMSQLLLEGFKSGNKIQLLNNDLTVDSCCLENNVIYDSNITVRMISPVTVLSNTSDKHTVYYSPEDEVFYEKIVANAKRKWCTLFDVGEFDLSVSPADGKFKKLVTLFKGTYVNAWYGNFVLKGSPEVINFVYNVGLGNKSSQGFGMFSLI